MSNTPPATPEPIKIDLSEIVPESVTKAIADGTVKTKEEAAALLGSHFLDFYKKSGYDEVKTVQIGTHKATQNQLKVAAEKLGFTINISDSSKTAEVIEQFAEQAKAIKENAGKGGLTDEEKIQLKDLQTYKKQLQDLQAKLEATEREKGEILTKAQSEKLELVKTTFVKTEMQKAIDAAVVSSKINATDKTKTTIKKLFDADYFIDVKLNDKGAPSGYDLRNKDTNELVLKGANQHFTTLEDLVLHVIKESSFEPKQGTSTTPAKPETGKDQPASAFGQLGKKKWSSADYSAQYEQNFLQKK
jgi:hypothetical protein